MGMRLSYVCIRNETIERVLADPPLIWRVLSPDDPDIYQEERRSALSPKPGFLRSLFRAGRTEPLTNEPEPEDLKLMDDEGLHTDLDKAWHGIHFLLVGSAWRGSAPLGYLLTGGTDVGDIDVGYGPARVLRPEQVSEFSGALSRITVEDFRSRFDPKRMMDADIYPNIWDRDPADDDTLGYLVEYFEMLKGDMHRFAEHGLGVVVYIS